MPLHRAVRFALTAVLVAGVLTTALPGRISQAAVLPSGFQEQIVFSGLTQPTNMEFAPDGRVFVTEKAGLIKVFDNLADTTPTIFANLTTNVHNTWDRGLLGLALAPTFPADPSVYVLYTYDAPPGGTAPVYNDGNCGSSNNWQCLVSGRLSRLTANGNVMTGAEQVLIKDEWCQQFPSHSIGDLGFGQDGMLYVSAGDGASFNAVDYGQLGDPVNPCEDPVDEGGALRAQDVRATGDPTGLDGAILRLDPATGAAAAGNPTTTGDMNARRIVAHGLRNPYRFTIRPGTNEVWLGDVGWNTWEEVNRIANPTASVRNFGWPCYENAGKTSYDAYNKPLCEDLYDEGPSGQSAPYVAWNHGSTLVPGEACPSGQSAVAGLAFYPTSGGAYPSAYQGALFFADYSRHCIWAMKPATAGGLPSTSKIETFASSASTPVDLEIGPGGELYYVDHVGGTIRRIRYFPGNQPPIADIQATPTSGGTPLTVSFSATGSTDADPADAGRLKYAWDFTNDGIVDSRAATASFTYSTAGVYQAKLTVTDTLGASDTASVPIS
ncbi:MAG TPA: PQQ-dependent sugar dehydrogenase, partial [Micromonosporaceae bacterium]